MPDQITPDVSAGMKDSGTITSLGKADQVYLRIKNSILRGEAESGEKLVAHRIAKLLNTSIIPVREALSRLEADDLVRVVPHTGIYVKGIDAGRLKELYPIRGVLEGYAVKLAAARVQAADVESLWRLVGQMDAAIADGDAALMGELNTRFHMALCRLSGNQSLVGLIDDLRQKTVLARLIFKFTPRRAEASNREHRRILEALEHRNARRAERIILRQSEKTLDLLIRHLDSRQGPGAD
jgi:DNA-binding GntR family transcriptional regulator